MVASADIKPDDVLERSYVQTYEREIITLHRQLAGLHTNLFVLEHLINFPFSILAPGQATFWSVVIRNLYFSSLSTAWALACDTDVRSLTVTRFKNSVIPRITNPTIVETVREKLGALGLEAIRDRLQPRLDELRTKAIAHLDRTLIGATPGQVVKLPAVSLTELKELSRALAEIINILGFGTFYQMLPLDYDSSVEHPSGIDSRPDVEQLLDDLASRSRYLHMPEREPTEWPFLCNALSDSDLMALNRYRVKLGLQARPRPAT